MKKLIWCILFLWITVPGYSLCEGLRFRMIDVGMAECLIISVDEQVMVVDTAYVKNADAIQSALKEMEAEVIDYLVLTHPHADHIGGAREILENHQVKSAILPPIEYGTDIFNSTMDTLKAHDVDLIYPQVGDRFELGGATVTVYGPHPVAYENVNNWSIVLMIEYAGKRILLTGDAEAEAEEDMLAYSDWLPLDADILKVGHHGSNTSSIYCFVDAVSPEYAIISCGNEEDEYPHVETALNLIDCGVSEILTTQMQGDILIHIYESGFYMVSGQNAESFTLAR